MKITKWKLITILEMDAERIVSVKQLEPIQMGSEEEEEEEDNENG